jgi:hypothetical protein
MYEYDIERHLAEYLCLTKLPLKVLATAYTVGASNKSSKIQAVELFTIY